MGKNKIKETRNKLNKNRANSEEKSTKDVYATIMKYGGKALAIGVYFIAGIYCLLPVPKGCGFIELGLFFTMIGICGLFVREEG